MSDLNASILSNISRSHNLSDEEMLKIYEKYCAGSCKMKLSMVEGIPLPVINEIIAFFTEAYIYKTDALLVQSQIVDRSNVISDMLEECCYSAFSRIQDLEKKIDRMEADGGVSLKGKARKIRKRLNRSSREITHSVVAMSGEVRREGELLSKLLRLHKLDPVDSAKQIPNLGVEAD